MISNKSFQGNVCQINLNHHNIAQVTEEKDTQIHWICSAVYDESNPTRQEINTLKGFIAARGLDTIVVIATLQYVKPAMIKRDPSVLPWQP